MPGNRAQRHACHRHDSMGEDVIQGRHLGLVLAILAAPFLLASKAGAAEQYPSQAVKIIVPNPAGGTADALPRIVADALTGLWKQAVVVENRAGAAGNVGAEAFARSQPDGYTLLASPPTTLAINQSLYKRLNYDPAGFKPITILASSPNVLIVNPKLGVSSVRELIEKAKADPGGIAYGSQGVGATSHLTTALFDNISSSLPQHRSGALRIIAVCTPGRSPHLPDVPTMSEAGLPGFTSFAWFGLVAPAETPDDIVAKISADVVAVINTDDVRRRFLAQGAEPVGNTPREMATFLEQERALWAGVIDKAKLKPAE
jgi:tripartite-type tricarboxylate transporter receptor subunit TctC